MEAAAYVERCDVGEVESEFNEGTTKNEIPGRHEEEGSQISSGRFGVLEHSVL